jgi:hypothetical protein
VPSDEVDASEKVTALPAQVGVLMLKLSIAGAHTFMDCEMVSTHPAFEVKVYRIE